MALAIYAWCRVREVETRHVIAIEGKTVRGARSTSANMVNAPYLMAALEHSTGVVLGQHQVEAKSNEIPAVRDLPASFDPADLRGCVITLDAVHTQDETAQVILDAGADYVFTVKANRARLLAALKKLPWNRVPTGSRSTQRGHGRHTTRTIKVIDLPDLPDWPELPGVAQDAQLRRTITRAGKKSIEVVYVITSAAHCDAPPTVLAAWVQGHWGIENKLHWVRDVTYDEDRSQVRTGTLPRIMASLRNTALSLLRLTGCNDIAAATRHHSRHQPQPSHVP